ncbi:RNaseH domain-containing protein [Kitasatospora sp. NPDC059747]|uniref:RNaseH domain-containing protein n=1 Tax=Kitasatospora sp. NPDC059747 TaxID=3346930 RepID=UPI0036528406
MLNTLAFTMDPKKLGKVVLYALSEDFAQAWSLLPSYRDYEGAKPVRPAYASLATALSAVTNQPVVIMPDTLGKPDDETRTPTMLATTKIIEPRLLSRAVRAWERHIRKDDDANTLAPLLDQCTPTRANLASFIDQATTGRPRAPQWFFRVAAWNIAAELARHPLPLPLPHRPSPAAPPEEGGLADEPDGQQPEPSDGAEGDQPIKQPQLTWLMDTNGSLLGWNHLLTNTAGRRRTEGVAMHKLDFRVITLPGEPLITVHVLPTFSRLATHWAGTRTAFVHRGTKTILRVPVGHRRTEEGWEPYIRGFAARVVGSCDLKPVTLCDNEGLSHKNRPIRVLIPGPTEHPLGKGTGTRFNFALARHIDTVLGPRLGLRQVSYVRTERQVARNAKGRVLREDLDHALAGTGHDHIRILALYDREHTRRRMIEALVPYTDSPDLVDDWEDESDCKLTACTSVWFRRLPALVASSRPDWNRELAFLDALPGPALNGVWVETVWNPKKSSRRDRGADYDPKRDLRRHFHQRGMVSQFIAFKEPPKAKEEAARETATTVPAAEPEPLDSVPGPATETLENETADLDGTEADKSGRPRGPRLDFPAVNGLRDLLLRLGAVDRRLADAVPLDHPAVLVGLHLRQQRASTRTIGSADQTQMVEVLTALHTHPDPTVPWRLEMYSRRLHAWLPIAEAESSFGAGPIGVAGHARHEDGARLVREEIRSALRVLPGVAPVVIFTDAEACRTIWPGLQNARLGHGPLPGDSLREDGRAAADVCINTSYGEVPTPIDRVGRRRPDPHKPAAPDEWLYRRTTTAGVTSWYLAQTSRTYNGFGQTGTNGSQHTRFTIPEALNAQLLAKDWSSFTAIQITVPAAGPYVPETLAALTAALCHQSLAWDSRTRHPVALHIAGSVDRNHAEYRGATLAEANPGSEEQRDS